MIKFIGWATVIGLGLYTGVLQLIIGAIGFAFLALGGALMSLVGA